MLSDGDSTAFKAVTDLAPYGPDLKIEKLECINHVDKRMGKALRKLSEEKRLGGNGKGKLTKAKCKNLQNYYRGAIISNIPNINKMRCAVWASLFHSMSTDDAPQHERCPKGNDSWCFHQVALANHETPGSHEDQPQQHVLDA